MSLREKLRRPSNLSLFFATIFLIPFQTALLYPFTVETLSVLQNHPESLFHYNPLLFIGFLLLPIIYCIFLSLLFIPKCHVNPVYIQIGAFVLFSIFILNYYLERPPSPDVFQNLLGYLIIIATYIITIGFFQFMIVRWVVGLVYVDCDRKTFLINGSPKEIMKILGEDFRRSRTFKKPIVKFEKTNAPIIILRYEVVPRNIIFAFGSYEKDKNKCVLSTIAYHKTISIISKSLTASSIRDSIIRDIQGRLKEKKPELELSPLNEENGIVSNIAFGLIEDITKSKIEIFTNFFWRMPKYYRWFTILTTVIIFILTIAYYFGYLDSNIYITALIPFVTALLFGIGLPLIKELSFKKIDEYF